MAELIDKLFDQYGVAVVGFDVVLAERDTSSGIEVLDALAQRELKAFPRFQRPTQKLRPSLDYDGLLRRQHEGPAGGAGLLLQQRGARGEGQRAFRGRCCRRAPSTAAACCFTTWTGYTGNLPMFLQERRRRRAHQSAGRLRRRAAPRAAARRVRRRSTTRRCRSRWCARCSRCQTGPGCRRSSSAIRDKRLRRAWNG